MINPELLKFCLEKGCLLDKESYELFSDLDSETAKKAIEKICLLKEKIITRSFLTKNAEKIRELVGDDKLVDKIKINFGISLEISRERYLEEKKEKKEFNKEIGNIKVLYSLANLSKKIEPADFVVHFRNRYSEIKRILQGRKELENLSSINKISGDRQNLSIIGIVLNKRVTKNKNLILDVEDLTGRITVLVSKSKLELYDKAKDILLDDVIGIKATGGREIIYANDIFFPDAFLQEKMSLEKDESVAFISDIHIGSGNFLKKNFEKFLSWLNGNVGDEKQRAEAKKIKYLFITGDTIDGVGIFPGQEELLEIKDIKEQYKTLANYLSSIRKDIKIVMAPGQHDSVRVAEPQPFIGKDYGEALYDLDNLILVSNPAFVEIKNGASKGLKIMMYHGASMRHFVDEIEHLRYNSGMKTPAKIVKEMLKRRHLAPIHGSVVYIPTEKEDPLVIKEVPDIMTTADLHRADVDIYNNVLIICSSCWQSTTPFEEKVGNVPDPCKVPIFNLRTREIKILDFSELGEEDLVCKEKESEVVCEVSSR